jgi:hypothetical protein
MDVGEGQKRTKCTDSPVQDGMVSNEARNGVIPLLLHTHRRNGPFRPTTAFQMPSVGVPASSWMWAKARSERGALIRLCGDGVVSNEARNGVIYYTRKCINPFCCTHTEETDRSDPPLR